jgi:hypothetical protein
MPTGNPFGRQGGTLMNQLRPLLAVLLVLPLLGSDEPRPSDGAAVVTAQVGYADGTERRVKVSVRDGDPA